MKNIKSLYFSKIIFPYIVERKKLKLIKYNRILQKNIYISIIDSKFYTRKYIIYETNKYVNEYDNNNSLSFDGEDLNGERNGKGKEYYYKGKIIFESEYLHGKRNGNGKKYNYVRTLNFEGEYLN